VPGLLAVALTASAGGLSTITVHWGDTLTGIAAKHGTTVSKLVALNHLPGNGNLIFAGSTLKVPGGPSDQSGHSRSSQAAALSTYTVRTGDSLIGLGHRFGVGASAIAALNSLANRQHIEIGQRLRIPEVSKAAGTSPSGPATALSHGAVHDLIVSTAQRFGVDPALALAVAWQESGFQQHVRSSAGALGIMQVMPSSGAFVSRWIVGHPLNLHNVGDNVTAGVALLGALLHQAPTRKAIAGYYQGLASVRSHGMYTGTTHYVNNVLALRSRFTG
jgi:LysM repeat protein